MTAVSQETRSSCIFRHVQRTIVDRRVNQYTFAAATVEHYQAAVPAEQRTVRFVTDGDPFDARKVNAKHIFRFADALVATRLPCDLEESLVEALPEPYRDDCLRDLCRRYGVMPVELGRDDERADVRFIADIATGAGGVLKTAAPILDDARIDACDGRHIPAALDALDALACTIEALRVRLRAVLDGGTPTTSDGSRCIKQRA